MDLQNALALEADRLEFLGDAALKLLVAHAMFVLFPNGRPSSQGLGEQSS